MAGLWCERSGVVNIGIEGMMLAVGRRSGSSTYARASATRSGTGWLWLSVGVAVLTGGLIAAAARARCR